MIFLDIQFRFLPFSPFNVVFVWTQQANLMTNVDYGSYNMELGEAGSGKRPIFNDTDCSSFHHG